MIEPWYEDRIELMRLYDWLLDRGEEPTGTDVGLFLEKPWKWEPERDAMLAEKDAQAEAVT